MSWLGFEDKVVVVTGGTGGIGRATLAAFHAEGARVVVLDHSPERAVEAAAALDLSGARAFGMGCDVRREEEVAAAAQQVEERFGGADVLVNNAGILRPGPLRDLPVVDWQAMLDVNLTGYLLCAKAFGAAMIARGQGALVHVASISASQPQPFSGAYSAGKAAVAMLSRQLAYEWGPFGVRSNVVSPGMVLTPLSETFYADETVLRAREAFVPIGRIGRPEDMAEAALFLASPRASYVTGQEIVVDGGLSQVLMGRVPRPGFAG